MYEPDKPDEPIEFEVIKWYKEGTCQTIGRSETIKEATAIAEHSFLKEILNLQFKEEGSDELQKGVLKVEHYAPILDIRITISKEIGSHSEASGVLPELVESFGNPSIERGSRGWLE